MAAADGDRGMPKWVKAILWIVGLLVVIVAVGVFVMWGPIHYANTITQPQYCATCHVMQLEYTTFEHSVHTDKIQGCDDCHLPNNNFFSHWFWAGVVGARDIAEVTFHAVPASITATPRSQRWLEQNCKRCHLPLQNTHPQYGPNQVCWSCHHEVTHRTQQQTGYLGSYRVVHSR